MLDGWLSTILIGLVIGAFAIAGGIPLIRRVRRSVKREFGPTAPGYWQGWRNMSSTDEGQ